MWSLVDYCWRDAHRLIGDFTFVLDLRQSGLNVFDSSHTETAVKQDGSQAAKKWILLLHPAPQRRHLNKQPTILSTIGVRLHLRQNNPRLNLRLQDAGNAKLNDWWLTGEHSVLKPLFACSDEDGVNKVCIVDSSLDSSPSSPPVLPVPQKSSTPHRNPCKQKPSESKWWGWSHLLKILTRTIQ